MENFNFCVGTRILFGKGQEEKLPELLRPYGNKVLLNIWRRKYQTDRTL